MHAAAKGVEVSVITGIFTQAVISGIQGWLLQDAVIFKVLCARAAGAQTCATDFIDGYTTVASMMDRS